MFLLVGFANLHGIELVFRSHILVSTTIKQILHYVIVSKCTGKMQRSPLFSDAFFALYQSCAVLLCRLVDKTLVYSHSLRDQFYYIQLSVFRGNVQNSLTACV